MAIERLGTHPVWAFAEHEHRDLVRGINRIHELARGLSGRPSVELSVHLLGVLDWFDGTLVPHVAWEESWLYPEIDARLDTPWATRAARFDHQQLRDLAGKLRVDQHLLRSGSSDEQHAEIRGHLFGLEALLRAHIEREERFLIPLLDEDRRSSDVPPVRSGLT